MQLIPYIVAYAAIGVFVIACLARVRMWSRMPIHVRWELYPVAHEAKRASYGGSYLEEGEWWNKGREVSMLGELKAMIPEILFLVALKDHNPKMWIRSFPFHFGLYLVAGATGVMFLGAVLDLAAPDLLAGTLGLVSLHAVKVMANAGLVLSLAGALGLLQRRLTDPDLKDFTKPADIFNLVFFLVAFGTAFASAVLVDSDYAAAQFFITNLVSFQMGAFEAAGMAGVLPVASLVLLSLLMAYIPLTHMSHFIGKYFAYHAIRWNDTPNVPGGPEEAEIQAVLGQKVTWAADHIDGRGEKTWVDVATKELKK